MLKTLKYSAAVVAAGAVMVASSISSEAETFNATFDVDFLTPIGIAEVTPLDFGFVEAGATGRVISLATDGTVGGADAADHISGEVVGDYTITGSALQTIDIEINNLAANNNVTPSSPVCAYDGGGENACTTVNFDGVVAPGAGGRTLLVGMTMTTDNAHVDGNSATPTYDIVVIYD